MPSKQSDEKPANRRQLAAEIRALATAAYDLLLRIYDTGPENFENPKNRAKEVRRFGKQLKILDPAQPGERLEELWSNSPEAKKRDRLLKAKTKIVDAYKTLARDWEQQYPLANRVDRFGKTATADCSENWARFVSAHEDFLDTLKTEERQVESSS
jgi:hypothetical protein